MHTLLVLSTLLLLIAGCFLLFAHQGEIQSSTPRRLFISAVPDRPTVATWIPLLSRCCILFCLFLPGLFNMLMILRLMGCGPLS